MTVDFHYHISKTATFREMSQATMPRGCIFAQKESDNIRYKEAATKHAIACGLFAHPRGPQWSQTVRLVSRRNVLAYLHVEQMDISDLELLDPVLSVSAAQGVPVVLHLSRHDKNAFPESEAARSLDYALQRFTELRIIVSHCGGENALLAIRLARSCPSVFLDTSCIVETSERSLQRDATTLLDRIATDVPAAQLLYGSDQAWPHYCQNSTELECLKKVFHATDLEDICVKNGAAILGALDLRAH